MSLLCQWERPLPGGTSMGPLNGKVRHFRLYANETTGKKNGGKQSSFTGWNDWSSLPRGNWFAAIQHRQGGLCLQPRGLLECLIVLPVVCLLVLTCPIVKSNRELQQLKTGRMIEDSGIKVWVTPSGEKASEVLGEGRGKYRMDSGRKKKEVIDGDYSLMIKYRNECYCSFANFLFACYIYVSIFIC